MGRGKKGRGIEGIGGRKIERRAGGRDGNREEGQGLEWEIERREGG